VRAVAPSPPRGWARRPANLLGLPYVVFVTILLVIPMGVLVLYSFWEAGFLTVERQFSLTTYRELVSDSGFWKVLVRSLAVGVVSASLITITAFTLCHGLVLRLPRLKNVLFALVIAASLASFLGRVLAAQSLLGDGGFINHVLMSSGIASGPVAALGFGYPAIVLTLIYVWLPVGALILFGALQDIDPATTQASRDLGAGRWNTLFRVTVPQAAAGLKTTFALMFIVTTADYITPSFVGGSKGTVIASNVSATFLTEGNLPRGSAMAFALIIAMGVTLGVLWLALKVVRRFAADMGAFSLRRRAAGRHNGPRRLFRWSVSRIAVAPVLAFLLVPIVAIIVFSLNTAPIVGLPITGLTTSWYGSIVSTAGFRDALTTSITLMAFDVVGSLAFGIALAFAIAGRVRRGVLFVLLPIAVAGPIVIPRTVIGVSYYASTALFNMPLGMVTTIAAQVLLSAPFVGIVLALRLASIDPHVKEAARDLGATPARQQRTVTLPLILPSIIAVAFMVAAFSLDEILVTSFTIGANSTLPVWMLSEARNGFTPGVDAVAVILLLGTIALFLLAAASMALSRVRFRRSARAALEAQPFG